MKGKLLGFALALVSVATVGVVQLTANAVDNSRDCDKYAIVYCGTMTEAEARNKYNNGDNAAIFRNFGISRSEITGMKQGVVYRDGTVRVNGRVVARNAMTAIRHFSGGNIPGSSTAKRVSVSRMADAQTALVKFDRNGRFMFAIMKPCGNPVTGNPTPPPAQPSAACKTLNVSKLTRTKFRFNARATVKDGAKVKAYVFQVTKRGKVIETKRFNSSKLSQSFTYSQNEPGKYRVRVTVKTTEGDKSGQDCVKPFEVKPKREKQPDVDVNKLVDGVDYKQVGVNVEFTYQIRVTNTGDVDLKDVKVTDTPEQGVALLSASEGDITDNTWTHTIPELKIDESMDFTIQAKVPEFLAGRINNTVCVDAPEVPGNPDDCDDAEVEVPPEGKTIVCNPETGENIRVDEDEADQYVPVGSPECEEAPEVPTPPELPVTGPTDAILQLVGAISLAGAGVYYVASRRA